MSWKGYLSLGAVGLGLFAGAAVAAEPVPVQKMEGVVHGFLVLRSESGEVLADGDLVQVPRRDGGIDSRLSFRFRDGSVHDERLFFTQKQVLRLEDYHLVQKGPSFPAADRGYDESRRGSVQGSPHERGRDRSGGSRGNARASRRCLQRDVLHITEERRGAEDGEHGRVHARAADGESRSHLSR